MDLIIHVPFKELNSNAKKIAMEGCGEEIFDVEWNYKRGTHQGIHKLKTTWPGFLRLVETEYFRKHADARGEAMLHLMKNMECENCHGFRLKPEMLKFKINGLHIGQLTEFTAEDALQWFENNFTATFCK